MLDQERAEYINQLKNVIDEYSNPNKDFEAGILRGIFYAVTVAEHGKDYADKKVDMKNP
jgi:hypothetical protein